MNFKPNLPSTFMSSRQSVTGSRWPLKAFRPHIKFNARLATLVQMTLIRYRAKEMSQSAIRRLLRSRYAYRRRKTLTMCSKTSKILKICNLAACRTRMRNHQTASINFKIPSSATIMCSTHQVLNRTCRHLQIPLTDLATSNKQQAKQIIFRGTEF